MIANGDDHAMSRKNRNASPLKYNATDEAQHPLGQRGAVGERPPDLLPRPRNQNLSVNRFSHSLLLLENCF